MNSFKKRVLVTGGSGYIGCLLCDLLAKKGYDVTNVDTEYYDGVLYHGLTNKPFTIVKDLRNLTIEDFKGFDSVVLLAELSNDPLGELVAPVTEEINHVGNARCIELAKKAGVPRVVYMSSTSVYGIADDWVDEESATNPQTEYARCKLMTENSLWELCDDNFTGVALRNSTTMGASPHQRLDVVVPNLSALAHTTGKIAMTSDGSPWRPLVHALDTCKAVMLALEAESEKVNGEVFNIGMMDNHGNSLNYQVREIAEAVKVAYPDCDVTFGHEGVGKDNRSYRVKFDKIRDVLGFRADWTLLKAAEQQKKVFEAVDFTPDRFQSREFIRLKQLQYLIDTKQVDEKFYWNKI